MEAKRLYQGPGWQHYLTKLNDLYEKSCELAVLSVDTDIQRALGYLHQASAYLRLLKVGPDREYLAPPLDTPLNPVTSSPMALDSIGRRLTKESTNRG